MQGSNLKDYDALKDTNGDIFAVSNDEANAAKALFEETEGIDIYHAAAVYMCLRQPHGYH